MKRLFSNIILVIILFSSCEGDRVAKAYDLTMPMLTYNFKQKNLVFPPTILIQVFKAEGELDIWARDSTRFKLFKTYKICRISGGFGRKLKERMPAISAPPSSSCWKWCCATRQKASPTGNGRASNSSNGLKPAPMPTPSAAAGAIWGCT